MFKNRKKQNIRNKKSKFQKSSKIFYLFMIIFSVYCGYRIIDTSFTVAAKKAEYENLVQQLEEQEKTNKELDALIHSDKDEIMEHSAREEYDYAYPSERIFIDMGGK